MKTKVLQDVPCSKCDSKRKVKWGLLSRYLIYCRRHPDSRLQTAENRELLIIKMGINFFFRECEEFCFVLFSNKCVLGVGDGGGQVNTALRRCSTSLWCLQYCKNKLNIWSYIKLLLNFFFYLNDMDIVFVKTELSNNNMCTWITQHHDQDRPVMINEH